MANSKRPIKDFKEMGKAMGYSAPPNGRPQDSAPGARGQAPQNSKTSPAKKLGPEPEFLREGADYVSLAEERIRSLKNDSNRPFGNLTTSKIRNILTMVNEIHNDVINLPDEALPPEIMDRIRHVKVRLAYEAGREQQDQGRAQDKKIKEFFEKAELITAIDHIGSSRWKFIRYARYLEALVAYHRYHGGND